MSEAELHILSSRLQGAKRAAAERGDLRTPLPVGYVYDDEGACVIDPDMEVQAAIRDVFAAFAAGGSAYQVVAAFVGRRFPLRAYGGVWAGQLRWGKLTHARALGVLSNPCYAGTYVYGRNITRRRVQPDGSVRTSLTRVPREQWPVVLHDHHEGYWTWADYVAAEAKLKANCTHDGARPAREGLALCQGIMFCGSCGRPMTTRYHSGGRAAYGCSLSRADHEATPTCRSLTRASSSARSALSPSTASRSPPGSPPRSVHSCGNVTLRPTPYAQTTPALDEQNVHAPADQRVERVGHRQGTQGLPGRRGTMPCPSESPSDAVSHCPHPWESSSPAQAEAGKRPP
jgi:hypothetical protein